MICGYAKRMIRYAALPLFLALSVSSGLADDLPPGVRSARLLPGWTDGEGNRISAFELHLEPGWKTYWRKPGDSGLPPEFDWSASENLASVTLHWPAPEAIRSGDELTLGYHDVLVLPFTATPVDAGQPVGLASSVSFGVCEKICVPAYLELRAPMPDKTPSPSITDALAAVPQTSSLTPACKTRDIEDGTQLEVLLPEADLTLVAMELADQPDVWVSSSILKRRGEGTQATADFVPPTGKPFDLDPSRVLMTVISAQGAVEIPGCKRQD